MSFSTTTALVLSLSLAQTTEEPPAPETTVPPQTVQDRAAVAPGTPLDVGTYIFGRFENRDGYDRLGVSRGRFSEGNFTVYRARLILTSQSIDLGNGLYTSFRFSPQAAGFLGNLPSTVSTAPFGVYEGWLRVGGDAWYVEAGRLRLNYGDSLFIGDLDWNQVGRSFDGFRGRFEVGEEGWVDAVFTQLADGINGPDDDAFAGDVFLAGFYGHLGSLLDGALTLEPYVFSQLWGQQRLAADTTTPRASQITAGVRVKRAFGPIDLRLEPGVQFGQRPVGTSSADVVAYQADAEIGFRVSEGLRVAIEGAYASGDDPDTRELEGWDDPFSTAHKFLGLMDVIGLRTNIASGVLHAQFQSGSFKALVDAHAFWRPETVPGQESYAGSEIDVQAIVALGRGMSIRGLYAAFIPGSDHFFVTTGFNDDVAHYVEAQYTFKL